jgi:hypothetical protein
MIDALSELLLRLVYLVLDMVKFEVRQLPQDNEKDKSGCGHNWRIKELDPG